MRVWNIPPLNKPPFSMYGNVFIKSDRNSCVKTLVGHSDAVWDVKAHATMPLLLSASADGTLKLWDVTNFGLTTTYWYSGTKSDSNSEFKSPTSICWGSHFICAAYRDSTVKIFDVESGAVKLNLNSSTTFGIFTIDYR